MVIFPLASTLTLKKLLQAGEEGLSILTVDLQDPSGYGRIVRDQKGNVIAHR